MLPTNSLAEQKAATLDDVVALLTRNQHTLDEMLMWLRITGAEKARNTLESALDTSEKRLVYQLSDGRTTREINAASGVSIATISNYWKRWFRIGLMKKVIVKGGGERHFRAFDLEDLGVEVPKSIKTEYPANTNPISAGGNEQ